MFDDRALAYVGRRGPTLRFPAPATLRLSGHAPVAAVAPLAPPGSTSVTFVLE
jgi:hypothetical protein